MIDYFDTEPGPDEPVIRTEYEFQETILVGKAPVDLAYPSSFIG
jgi:hypothetical protein